jgi:hypothetical protein
MDCLQVSSYNKNKRIDWLKGKRVFLLQVSYLKLATASRTPLFLV